MLIVAFQFAAMVAGKEVTLKSAAFGPDKTAEEIFNVFTVPLFSTSIANGVFVLTGEPIHIVPPEIIGVAE